MQINLCRSEKTKGSLDMDQYTLADRNDTLYSIFLPDQGSLCLEILTALDPAQQSTSQNYLSH